MTIVFQSLVAVASLSFIGLVTFASVLAALKEDTKGCAFSPDNSGCLLNRPIDQKKQSATERLIS
jgi:hypothetical protein